MKLLELAQQRFSCRKYTDENISQEDLDYILETVRLAPSACNRQPWKFIIVESKEAQQKLQQCYDREWFRTAPLYIICARNVEENWIRKMDEKEHGDIDVAIAAEHLCLAASECGLGTCFVCNFDVDKMHEAFSLDGFEPVVIIPIGHIAPDCLRPEKNRKGMDEIIVRV